MAGSAGDYYGSGRSSEVIPSLQPFQSMESLAECRSSEQVENCIPSTSPPYWDTDDNNDFGPKPSDLYGRFTWKIDNFSQINKKELRSNPFMVGGYKWYILIYPQGCDVSNHLSLFLCVDNHDKLLPGWSHFAQFTIAVVNRDPKKSKFSDTLHRFWKKEHDWGWKKFMELSKVMDGFVVSNTLIIKAQVQVIREKTDRPFLCLDRQYRGELVRVYLTNVEQICRRFFEEKRAKLLKLIEDKARWSSFCEFWLSTDDKTRHSLYREKADTILKVVVKHFFVEKEVTSTLVMDSLYSGLKALECESRSKNVKSKSLETEETLAPLVRLEEDMFVLVDDVLGLLQRVALESRPPKDEKGPQNRTKDGNSGEDFKKDAMEPDERRLTELGHRTVEIFVLGHIFSNKIQAAFEEAVALKMQEELIREEEEAGKADYGQKAKHAAIEKEKRAKRKQGKHKRKNRKGKDKGKDGKSSITIEDEQQRYDPTDDVTPVFTAIKPVQFVPDKPNAQDDVSDVSDTGDDVSETVQPESEDRDTSTVNWDTDTSEVPLTDTTGSGISGLPLQNGREEKNMYSMEDSSSTCSTESAPSVVMNCFYKGNKTRTSPNRGKCHCGNETKDCTAVRAHEFDHQPSEPVIEAACQYDSCQGSRDTGSDQIMWLQRRLDEKEVITVQQKLDLKGQVDVKRPSKQNSEADAFSFSRSPAKNLPSSVKPMVVADQTVPAEAVSVGKRSSNSHQKVKKVTPIRTSSSQVPSIPKSAAQNLLNLSKSMVRHTEKTTAQPAVPMSRPSSAPLVPPRPFVPVVSTVQTTPSLARSVSAAGRLANGSQSYKNAIIGNSLGVTPLGSNPSTRNPCAISSQPLNMSSSPLLPPQSSGSDRSGFTFGSVSQDAFQSRTAWLGETSDPGTSSTNCDSSLPSRFQNINIHDRSSTESRTYLENRLPPSVPSRQTQSMSSVEDFPHLDMINHLLDEEQNMGRPGETEAVFHSPDNGYHHPLNQQFMFQDDISVPEDVSPSINYGGYESYHDVAHRAYGIPFDTNDALPQAGPSVYENEFLNGALQYQWDTSADHFPFLNAWTIDEDGYQYQVPEYANLGGYMYL